MSDKRPEEEARAALKTWEKLAPPDPVLDKPVEVALAQAANAEVPTQPFTDMSSAHSVKTENDLRKA